MASRQRRRAQPMHINLRHSTGTSKQSSGVALSEAWRCWCVAPAQQRRRPRRVRDRNV